MSKRMGGSRFAKLTSTHPGPWTVEESKELAAEATRARASDLEWKGNCLDALIQVEEWKELAAKNFQSLVASEKERDEWKAKAEELSEGWEREMDALEDGSLVKELRAALAAAEARAEELREVLDEGETVVMCLLDALASWHEFNRPRPMEQTNVKRARVFQTLARALLEAALPKEAR